jgi:hypothetical protein
LSTRSEYLRQLAHNLLSDAKARVIASIRAWSRHLPALVLLLIGCAVLWGWTQDNARIIANAPIAWLRLTSAKFRVDSVHPRVVGAAELGQGVPWKDEKTHAALSHIEFSVRGAPSGLYIRNVAADRALQLIFEDGTAFNSDRARITPGLSIAMGGARLTFADVGATGFSFTRTDSAEHSVAYRFDTRRGLLPMDDHSPRFAASAVCANEDGLRIRLLRTLRELLQSHTDETVIRIGGTATCRQYRDVGGGVIYSVAQKDWPWHAIAINRSLARGSSVPLFWVKLGDFVDDAAAGEFQVTDRSGTPATFHDLAWRIDTGDLAAIKAFVAGRTRYDFDLSRVGDEYALTLTPSGNRILVPSAPGACKTGIVPANFECYAWFHDEAPRYSIAGRNIILLVLVIIWFSPLAARRLAGWRGKAPPHWPPPGLRWRTMFFGASLLTVFVPEISSLIHRLLALVPEIDRSSVVPVAVNFALAGLALFASSRSGLPVLFWFSLLLLVIPGTLTMAALATSFDNTKLVSNFLYHKLLVLDMLPPIIVGLAVMPRQHFRRIENIFAQVRTSLGGVLARLRSAHPFIWAIVYAVAAVVGISGVALLMGTGAESGAGGFQPAEFGKYLIVVLSASLFTIFDRDVWSTRSGRLPWWRAGTAIVIILILGMSPYARGDFSPILILIFASLLTGNAALLFALNAEASRALRLSFEIATVPVRYGKRFSLRYLRRHLDFTVRFLAVVLAILVAAATYFVPLIASRYLYGSAAPAAEMRVRDRVAPVLFTGRPFEKIRERVLSWDDIDPSLPVTEQGVKLAKPQVSYKDFDEQVVRSRVVINHGVCQDQEGARSAADAGLVSKAYSIVDPVYRMLVPKLDCKAVLTPAGPVSADAAAAPARPRSMLDFGGDNQVPVVAYDFMPAFMIGHFGLHMALFVFASQVLFVITCLLIAVSVWSAPGPGRGANERAVSKVLAASVAGFMILFVSQWLLAWANSLGLLPVMGQPMTWLAFGTSHHLFMAVPCVVQIFIALKYRDSMLEPLTWRAPPAA